MVAAIADKDLRLVNLVNSVKDILPKENALLKKLKAVYPAALKTGKISFHQNSDVKKII
jgi:hypothetical protein